MDGVASDDVLVLPPLAVVALLREILNGLARYVGLWVNIGLVAKQTQDVLDLVSVLFQILAADFFMHWFVRWKELNESFLVLHKSINIYNEGMKHNEPF